jgi:hypothetical protein
MRKILRLSAIAMLSAIAITATASAGHAGVGTSPIVSDGVGTSPGPFNG